RTRSASYLSFLPMNHVVEGILATYAPYWLPAPVRIAFLDDFRQVREALPKVRPTIFFSVPRLYERAWAALAARRLGRRWVRGPRGPERRGERGPRPPAPPRGGPLARGPAWPRAPGRAGPAPPCPAAAGRAGPLRPAHGRLGTGQPGPARPPLRPRGRGPQRLWPHRVAAGPPEPPRPQPDRA